MVKYIKLSLICIFAFIASIAFSEIRKCSNAVFSTVRNASASSQLPEGVVAVKYVGFNAKQYIDTCILPSEKIDFDVICSYDNTPYIITILCGGQSYNNNEILFAVARPANNGGIVISQGSGNINVMSGETKQYAEQPHRHQLSNGSYFFDGIMKGTFKALPIVTSNTMYLGIAHRNGALNFSEAFRGKIYSCIFYENGRMAFNAVPVKLINENGQEEGAMYDFVSKKVLRNIGTEPLAIGPDL